ncbi:MAG: hypothetical protein ACRCTS_03540 [Fusobacteriaceae bacterium]
MYFDTEIIHTIDLIDSEPSRTGDGDVLKIKKSGLPARVNLTEKIDEDNNQRKPLREATIRLFEDVKGLKVGQLIQFEGNIYEVQTTNRTVDFDGSFIFSFIRATKSIKKLL